MFLQDDAWSHSIDALTDDTYKGSFFPVGDSFLTSIPAEGKLAAWRIEFDGDLRQRESIGVSTTGA